MRKKRRFKVWVLYASFSFLVAIMILLLDRLQLIQAIDSSTVNITKACILLVAYESLRCNIKTIIKREKEKE